MTLVGRSSPLPTGFGALWTTVAVDLVGFGIVIPILPLYAERYDASPAVIGLLLASFSLAQLIASPLWGMLSDRIGRKPVLVTSLAGSAAGGLVTAFAPNLAFLFVGRLIDGASGGSVAVAQAAATDLAEPAERPRLLGLIGAAWGVGFVLGPAVGGIAGLAGERVPFILAAAVAALNALVAVRRLPETRRVDDPVHRPRRRRVEGLRSLLVVGFMTTAAFSAFEATFALLAARRLDLTGPATSAVFVVAGVLIAVTNTRAVAPAVRHLGELRTLRLGLILDGLGLVMLAGTRSLAVLGPAIGFLAVGHGLAVPALMAAVAARVPAHDRGAAMGSQQGAASLARIAGPLAAGAVFGVAGPAAAFVAAASVALGATLGLRERSEQATEMATAVPGPARLTATSWEPRAALRVPNHR